MKGLVSYASLPLAGVLTKAHPVVERAAGPFLSQQRTYGVKLFYKDHDLVGDAAGHYVSYKLMVHRESATGDAVQLNMIHGTHFQVSSQDTFQVGKVWGLWLWLLNDGSVEDAEARAQDEFTAWPYAWFEDEAYQSRGSVSGRLVLSDGRPAAHAAVFLGDNEPNETALDMGSDYYYTGYADANGNWTIRFEVAANVSASAAGAGQATLIVSLAGYSTGASSVICANDQVIGNLTSGTPQLLNDPGSYRSATVAGEWRYFEFSFDSGLLSAGWNTVVFQV
ncbi:rhamnogalacturonate lyase [Diaporthe helianthi]|uniref:Rhamnogalacturonate lyase n=1 Tax=Diaporthe helianthi TaxID=158607 RepID=A0A2P5I122_DIAHE|nr:rhamnogalacturonate lyase [Diaporthe helianthi]